MKAIMFAKGKPPEGAIFAPEGDFMDEVEVVATLLLNTLHASYGVMVIYGEDNPRSYNCIADAKGDTFVINLLPL